MKKNKRNRLLIAFVVTLPLLITCNSQFIEKSPVLPAAPTGLHVVTATEGSISLAWDPVPGATSYIVARDLVSTSAGFGTLLQAGALTTLTDGGLDPGTVYYYRVLAHNAAGDGLATAPLSASTVAAQAIPEVNSLHANSGDGFVTLNWIDPADKDFSGVRIYLDAAFMAFIPAGTQTYELSGLTSGHPYTVKVTTMLNRGPSGIESIGTSVEATLSGPSIPLGLACTTISASSINITWLGSDGAPDGYSLFRSISPTGPFECIEGQIHGLSYSDFGLAALTPYYYEVSAYRGSTSSGKSDCVNGRTASSSLLPAPANFRQDTASSTATKIGLLWDVISGADSYRVFRFNKLTNLSDCVFEGTGTSYIDTGLDADTNYGYQVAGWNSATGTGELSLPTLWLRTAKATLAAPGNLRITASTESSISLAWDGVVGASGYRVYQYNETAGTYSLGKGLTSVPSITLSDLYSSITMRIVVMAFDGSNENGAASAEVVAKTLRDTTPPPEVATISANRSFGPNVTLSWFLAESPDIDHVIITRSPGSAAEISYSDRSRVIHYFTDMDQYTNYTIKIQTVDAAGNRSAGRTIDIAALPTSGATISIDSGIPADLSISFSGGSSSLGRNQSMTIQALQSLSSCDWRLDGASIGTDSSVTIAAANLSVGKHVLVLMGRKDGHLYSSDDLAFTATSND